MMRSKRALSSILMLTLAACGGGGGGSVGTVPGIPSHPTQGATTAKFSFRLPSRTTMTRIRRPAYLSQGTQGVSIDWISSDPTHPDYAAPVSAVCPGTLPAGVTACSIDAQGNTDYTFLLSINPGTYTITVTTFDAAPSGAPLSFASTAHVLSQGQMPATISAGQSNTISPATFYGVPASVTFVPAPGQVHTIDFNGGFGIIGSVAQTFFAQSLDAGGYAITGSDPGAPTITVAESAGDSPQLLSIAQSNSFTYTVRALSAAAGAAANVTITSTAGGGLVSTATSNVTITPIPELWTTQAAGGNPTAYGLNGYALIPPTYRPSLSPIDFVYDNASANLCGSGLQCQFESAAATANGVVVAESVQTARLYEFAPTTSFTSALLPGSALPFTTTSPANLTFDDAGRLYVIDNTSGTLVELPSPVGSPVTASTQIRGAAAIAIAPSMSALPLSLQQSIWTVDPSGNFFVFPPFTGSFGAPIPVNGSTVASPPTAMTFDSNGNLWVDAGTTLYTYSVAGSTSGIMLTPLAGPYALTGAQGSNFGAAPNGTMYLGYFGSFTGIDSFTLTGCPSSCTINEIQALNTLAPVDASIVVP